MSERNLSDSATFMLGNKCRREVCITDFHCLLSPLQPLFASPFARYCNPSTVTCPSNHLRAWPTIQTQTSLSL